MLADSPALGRKFERSNIRPERNENRLLAFMSLWRTTATTELTHASVAKLQNEDWSANGPGPFRVNHDFKAPLLCLRTRFETIRPQITACNASANYHVTCSHSSALKNRNARMNWTRSS